MAEWVHTFKGAVLASEYDVASHMNSRMYVSRFDQATWFLLHAVGVERGALPRLCARARCERGERRRGVHRQRRQRAH